MQDDKDLLRDFIKASGKKVKIPSDFRGFEANSLMAEIIELSVEELINFD